MSYKIKRLRLWVLSAILLMPLLGHSQLVRAVAIKIGAVAANQTWRYSFQPVDWDTKTRMGLDVGLSVEWLDLSHINILTEAHYLQKGMKLEIPVATEQFPEGTGELRVKAPRIDYLSLPLLAKYSFEFDPVSLYILAGPRFDILLASHGDGYDVITDKFNKNEFGATFGAGVDLSSLVTFALGMEFRYSPSFQSTYASQNLRVTNRSMEFLMAILL